MKWVEGVLKPIPSGKYYKVRRRTEVVVSAPAKGLCLEQVYYSRPDFLIVMTVVSGMFELSFRFDFSGKSARYAKRLPTRMDFLTCVWNARIYWPGLPKNGCKYCGIPMSGFDFNGLVCAGCREDPPRFKRGKCLFLLDQNGKESNP